MDRSEKSPDRSKKKVRTETFPVKLYSPIWMFQVFVKITFNFFLASVIFFIRQSLIKENVIPNLIKEEHKKELVPEEYA